MSELTNARKSLSARKAWLRKKRQGGKSLCFYCENPIFLGGVYATDTKRRYHKNCFDKQVRRKVNEKNTKTTSNTICI